MATITYKDGVRIEGNMFEGKMYRANGRWAKVMSTDYLNGTTRVSVAFGRKGDVSAFHVSDRESYKNGKDRANIRQRAQHDAMRWVVDQFCVTAF